MARSDVIAGLDIGTTKTAAVIASLGRDGAMDIVGFGVAPSLGLRKGVVTDLEETVKSIEAATESAERMAGVNIEIFLLSVLQSCCVPTSSELTFGLAGYLAYKHQLSLPGAILVGASGELVGAYVAWFIGRYAGRGFVDRFGKYLLLTHRDLDRAEAWYDRHGNWGVFGGRLIPVIRNFVAIPAGVAEVPLLRFGVLTAAGSLIWDGAWTLIGYGVGSSYNKVAKDFGYLGYVLGALAVAAIVFVIVHRYRSYKEATARVAPEHHVPAHRRGAAARTSPVQVGMDGTEGTEDGAPVPQRPVNRRRRV